MAKSPREDRQREHQANERTFLAWLRTAIALIGFGFAIARFGLFLQELQTAIATQAVAPRPLLNSQTLGIGLVILGIALIALAAWRYNQVLWQIERGDYQPQPWIIWVTTGLVILLGILSVPLMFLQHPNQPGSSSNRSQIRN